MATLLGLRIIQTKVSISDKQLIFEVYHSNNVFLQSQYKFRSINTNQNHPGHDCLPISLISTYYTNDFQENSNAIFKISKLLLANNTAKFLMYSLLGHWYNRNIGKIRISVFQVCHERQLDLPLPYAFKSSGVTICLCLQYLFSRL